LPKENYFAFAVSSKDCPVSGCHWLNQFCGVELAADRWPNAVVFWGSTFVVGSAQPGE
jgi:hypothetical protein